MALTGTCDASVQCVLSWGGAGWVGRGKPAAADTCIHFALTRGGEVDFTGTILKEIKAQGCEIELATATGSAGSQDLSPDMPDAKVIWFPPKPGFSLGRVIFTHRR